MWFIEFQQTKEMPEHLMDKSGIASQVLFSAFFALAFINIYHPFNSLEWVEQVHGVNYFLWSVAIVALGFFCITISRIIMYVYAKHHRMFHWVYALWIFVEISSVSVIYTMIAYQFFPVVATKSGETDAVDFFWGTFFCVFFILLIPTALSWLYLSFVQKKKELVHLQKQYQETAQNGVNQPSVFQFCDEKGEPRVSLKVESIIWIEAADNYVTIKYQNQDKISDVLLRNSLKRLSEDFKDTSLFRCHRSYMVNFMHAVAIRRGTEGFVVELDIPNKEIPISKTYKEETSAAFMRFCQK